MSQVQIDQLKSQLRAFGLDPREWLLAPSKDQRVRLRHRHDHAFRLLGRWKNDGGGLKWTTLSLISL